MSHDTEGGDSGRGSQLPLPHTGGVGAAWLAGGGAVVLAATLTLVWWWRRRNEAEKPHTPGGDAP